MLAERAFLASTGPRNILPEGRILCYHAVGTPQWGINDVPPARFRLQVQGALECGARFISASSIARGDGGPNDLAITFDDGLLSVLQNAAPVLSELGIPWTVFLVAGWADGQHRIGPDLVMDWAAIEKAAAMGATIGSHSMTHSNFARLCAEAAAWELEESRRLIQSRIGIDTREFAIPFGQSHDWNGAQTRAAYAAGYHTVFAQSQERRPAGTVGRTFITGLDDTRIFRAALQGRFDAWEEWM